MFALTEQVGSRWTFQAAAMDGDLGVFRVKPDQMQMVMPILVLLLLNLWNWLVQPMLDRCGVRLQMKFVMGGILVAAAFVVAGCLELALMRTAAVMPADGECQVRIFNTQRCDYSVLLGKNQFNLSALGMVSDNVALMAVSDTYEARLQSMSADCADMQVDMHLSSGKAMSYFIGTNGVVEYVDSPRKDIAGRATLRIYMAGNPNSTLEIVNTDADSESTVISESTRPTKLLMSPATYRIESDDGNPLYAQNMTLQYAGVYTLLVRVDEAPWGQVQFKLFEISPPNTISIAWILPQYVLIALSETLFAVTAIYFAYREAPASMKTVAQSMYLLSMSAGNFIDVIIVSVHMFDSQAFEFFAFAGIMLVNCIVMFYLVNRYKKM